MIELEDQQAAQNGRKVRRRRAVIWLAAVILLGVLLGLMGGRLLNPLPAPGDHRLFWQVIEQTDGVDLLVRAPGEVVFRRDEHASATRYLFEGVELEHSPSVGRKVMGTKTLAWRLENREGGVQLLLVGLNTPVNASHQLLSSSAGRSGLKVMLRLP